MKFFWGLLAIIFIKPIHWDFEILLDDHLFCSPIAVLQAIIKILDWLFKLF